MKKTPTDQEIQNFQPKCLLPLPPPNSPPAERQGISFTATGFVLPCCYLASYAAFWPKASGESSDGGEGLNGHESFTEDEKIKLFFAKELHIDNNETIDDIINSDTWQNFMSDLINKPEESSPLCFIRCSQEK